LSMQPSSMQPLDMGPPSCHLLACNPLIWAPQNASASSMQPLDMPPPACHLRGSVSMPEPLHSTGASEDVTEEQTVHASLRSYANGPRGCTRGLTAAVWRRRCALWRASSSARRRGALEGFTAAVVWPLETVSDCVPCVEAGAPRQHRPKRAAEFRRSSAVLRAASRGSVGA
jgi:hypothetical protein